MKSEITIIHIAGVFLIGLLWAFGVIEGFIPYILLLAVWILGPSIVEAIKLNIK